MHTAKQTQRPKQSDSNSGMELINPTRQQTKPNLDPRNRPSCHWIRMDSRNHARIARHLSLFLLSLYYPPSSPSSPSSLNAKTSACSSFMDSSSSSPTSSSSHQSKTVVMPRPPAPSPRPQSRLFCTYSSDDGEGDCGFEPPPRRFLDCCYLCRKPLAGNRDIFMYRGDTPFCSEECRQEQMDTDDAKEKRWKRSAEANGAARKGREKIHVRTSTAVAV